MFSLCTIGSPGNESFIVFKLIDKQAQYVNAWLVIFSNLLFLLFVTTNYFLLVYDHELFYCYLQVIRFAGSETFPVASIEI